MNSPKPRAIRRRQFVQFLVAGSAAAIADPLGRLARAGETGGPRAADAAATAGGNDAKSASSAAPGTGAVPAELAEEIRNQKEYLEKTLKTIRDYELPPGSDQAFLFAPRKSRRGR